MKAKEIREMSPDEMETKVKNLHEEYFNLRFQKGVGQLENTSLVPKIRRDIARIKTIIKERNK